MTPFSATPPPRVQGAGQLELLKGLFTSSQSFCRKTTWQGAGSAIRPQIGSLRSASRLIQPPGGCVPSADSGTHCATPAFLTHRHSHACARAHTHPCRFSIKAPSLACLACQSMPTRHSRAWAELICVHSWVSVMLGAASQTGDKDSGSRLSPDLLLPGNAPPPHPFSWPNTCTPSPRLEGDGVSCASGLCWELRAWLHSNLHFLSMTLSILGTSKRIKSPPQKAQGGHKGHDGGRGSSLCFKKRVTCNQKSADLFPLASSLVPTPGGGGVRLQGQGLLGLHTGPAAPLLGPIQQWLAGVFKSAPP